MSEADHERVAAGLARLAQPRPEVTTDVLAYLDLDPATAEARALVLLCRRYDLDPLLGHVAVIKTKGGNKAYITRDGMLEIAHRSGQLDGIVVDEERESDNGWSATVSVFRRDMSHPFTFRGGCGKDEQQAKDNHGAEMALARAERRSLRRAFNIPIDDVYDGDGPEPTLDAHRVVDAGKDGSLTCACGERFNTVWAFGAHRKGEPPAPHKAAELAGKPKRGPRRDDPPPEFYDSLPEAKGR